VELNPQDLRIHQDRSSQSQAKLPRDDPWSRKRRYIVAYIRLTWPPDEYCLPGMIAQPTALCWTLAGVLEGLPSVLPRNVLTSTPLWWIYLKYLAIAQRFIAETGANDRVSVMAADVLSGSINGSFDAVVMCNSIQIFLKTRREERLRMSSRPWSQAESST